jgi:hypothetical protein
MTWPRRQTRTSVKAGRGFPQPSAWGCPGGQGAAGPPCCCRRPGQPGLPRPWGKNPAINRGSAPGGRLRGAFSLPRGPVWGPGCRRPQMAGSPVPKHQVAQPVDVGGQQDRQADEILPALHPHRVQQELGRDEAAEQPQEKAEHSAHGGILSHWPEIATRGCGHRGAGSKHRCTANQTRLISLKKAACH